MCPLSHDSNCWSLIGEPRNGTLTPLPLDEWGDVLRRFSTVQLRATREAQAGKFWNCDINSVRSLEVEKSRVSDGSDDT